MPSTYYDADVSGSGSASWSSPSVIFVSADIITPSPLATQLLDSDEWLRQGWFALGDSFNIGLGTFDYWSSKIYIDFDHQLWTPDPSANFSANESFELTRTRIRWQIASGGLVHLHVFGF
jgi:hypothetical protein